MRLTPVLLAARRLLCLPRLATVLLALAALHGSPAQAQSRGELLYNTHCIACHTTQMHWRNKKLATDWDTLEAQVRRWQQAASLGWRDDDIAEVTRYLNERYYDFTPTSLSGLSGAPNPSPFAESQRQEALSGRP